MKRGNPLRLLYRHFRELLVSILVPFLFFKLFFLPVWLKETETTVDIDVGKYREQGCRTRRTRKPNQGCLIPFSTAKLDIKLHERELIVNFSGIS